MNCRHLSLSWHYNLTTGGKDTSYRKARLPQLTQTRLEHNTRALSRPKPWKSICRFNGDQLCFPLVYHSPRHACVVTTHFRSPQMSLMFFCWTWMHDDVCSNPASPMKAGMSLHSRLASQADGCCCQNSPSQRLEWSPQNLNCPIHLADPNLHSEHPLPFPAQQLTSHCQNG